MKNKVMNIAKKNRCFLNLVRFLVNVFGRIKCFRYKLFNKVDDKLIVFSCFDGTKYCDSPKYLYEYMLSDKKYDDYNFVWFFEDVEKYDFLKNNRNTKVIKIKSSLYYKVLFKAKYWFFNYKIAEFIYPTKNNIFVQCWHGTPLKKLGFDLDYYDNSLNDVNDMKKRYEIEAKKISYFISPSKYTTEKIISAWNLKEYNKENIIIEEGYPRNDALFKYSDKDIKNIKKKLNIDNDKKVILYAPTFRANQHESSKGYVYNLEIDFDMLQEKFANDYVILFRTHYFVANQFDFEKYNNFVYDLSDYDDINDLFIISDLLITDYSSVMFDYANLKKPMIFYMYDLDYYKNNSNGFYFDVEKVLPGDIVKTNEELIKCIENIQYNVYNNKYNDFNKKFNYLDDCNSSKRVLDNIFNKN